MTDTSRIERILTANGFAHDTNDEPHVDEWALDQRPNGSDILLTYEGKGWHLSRSPKDDEPGGEWTDVGTDLSDEILLSLLAGLVNGFDRADVPAPTPIASGRSSPEWKVHTPLLLSEIMTNPNMGVLKIPVTIFANMLAQVAGRASDLGDIALDDLMIRLVLYDQGDPTSDVFDLGAAASLNESRVREQHLATPDTPNGFSPSELNTAIARALATSPEWDKATKVHDWRNHVGRATQTQWAGLPFAARVAVALDAERVALSEEWD